MTMPNELAASELAAPIVPMDDFARGFDAGYLEAAKTLEMIGPEAVWRYADFLRERAAAYQLAREAKEQAK